MLSRDVLLDSIFFSQLAIVSSKQNLLIPETDSSSKTSLKSLSNPLFNPIFVTHSESDLKKNFSISLCIYIKKSIKQA